MDGDLMDEYDITQAIKRIEDELIASMIRNMQRHKVKEVEEKKEWSMWQAEQLKALDDYKKRNQKKYGIEFSKINEKIPYLIAEARRQGNLDQEIKLLETIGKRNRRKRGAGDIEGTFFKMNDRKINVLIDATVSDIGKAETAILRRSNDAYRKIIYNAQVYAASGAGTYAKAVDMATKDFLSAGIQCVQYKNGAMHTLSDYADMAIRTASKRAYLTGEGEKRQEWGIHTVIINKRGNPCPKCLPFVGKILIDDVWSGGSSKDGDYPLMSSAIAAGLYHPRCKDSHTTYFEGTSTPPDGKHSKEEINKIIENYNNEQKQQYASRQVEKFNRLSKFSLDSENKKQYQRRAEKWEVVEKAIDSDIIKLGTASGALTDKNDPFYVKRDEHAKRYYESVRNSKKKYIVESISNNTGFSRNSISKVYDHVFLNEYELYNGRRRFDPDYDMAESFRRVRDGKDIQEHDLIMLKHEHLEYGLMTKLGMTYEEAHELTQRKYNYQKALNEFKKKNNL